MNPLAQPTQLLKYPTAVVLGKMIAFGVLAYIIMKISLGWLISPMLSWILPLNGIVVGAALVSHRRLNVPPWAVFLPTAITMIIVRLQFGLPPSMALLWTAINAIEYVVIWWFLHKEFSNHLPISLPALSKMVVVGLCAVPASSALGYCWMQELMAQPRWDLFWPYWLRNASSVAIFTTSILLLSNDAISRLKSVRWRTHFWFAIIVNCVMLGIIFCQEKFPYLFLFAPSLMFLVVKGRGLGAAVGMISAMLFAFISTYLDFGPLQLIHAANDQTNYHRMIVLHLFLIAVASVAVSGAVILEDNIRLMKQLKEKEARMSDLARHDPLTGLLNRRGLYAALQPYFDAKTVMGAILLDIDHFKRYNDTYGHVQGDECLTQISDCLRNLSTATTNPVITARLGGEEFLVVVPHCNTEQTQALAEKLLECVIAQNIEHKATDRGFVTVSLGVSQTLAGDDSITPLVHRADQALYEAKNNGRAQVRVY